VVVEVETIGVSEDTGNALSLADLSISGTL